MKVHCVLLIVLLTEVICQQSEDRQAIVVLSGPTGVKGNITFTQARNSDTVTITGTVTGLTKGEHGFHVHEKGDLRDGCASTGSHFNPYKKKHGAPEDTERHVGDLGNILANDEGVAIVNKVDKQISLSNAKRNILGRGVVVHSDPDDMGKGGHSDSLTTGHAGSRVACGIIGTLNPNNASSIITVMRMLLPLSVTLSIMMSSLQL